MAKHTSGGSSYNDPHDDLFALSLDRKRRRLFLPQILDEAAKDQRLNTKERDAAYEVIKDWWDHARSGRLNRKETSIDDRFLSEVFGRELGYRGVTESTNDYERERQFHIPNVGDADGALGLFPPADPDYARVVIELKGAMTHLDRDRSNGRTAVQQVWDYLNAMPETCVWGIVSNFTTIRLYHRSSSQKYERFTLRGMVEDRRSFDRFYAIFERGGLVKGEFKQPPRAITFLRQTTERQSQVGDELYKYYSDNRQRLIQHLHRDKGIDLDTAIRIAQKLIDRVLFIAFCEDRDLIVSKAIDKAFRNVPPFSKALNPKWQNFLGLFSAMDKGSEALRVENGFNGGLFREDDLIDRLDLADEPWANFFHGIGDYDYEHEVNVDVLGHLFEKSITELEKLRLGALFAEEPDRIEAPMMPKSPQRKLFGVYYTPVEFTAAIVHYTIDDVVAERFEAIQTAHGLTKERVDSGAAGDDIQAYWRDCLDALGQITVCDPACGSGAFLIEAYEALFRHYSRVVTALGNLSDTDRESLFDAIPDRILTDNLFGVDLQSEAVEIAQLSLWLHTARKGKTLADLSKNIVCGNSLTDDPAVHPRAMNWKKTFPHVFAGDEPGFDCVIGNPPWERIKVQEREFFALSAPDIASAVNAAGRRAKVKKLETENPELYEKYLHALAEADRMLTYARKSGRYPLTGKGDINTYVLFAELAMNIVAPKGRVGLLVPSGVATDKTTAKLFNELMATKRLRRLYDFENKKGIFADVHRAFKFSVLNLGGSSATIDEVDFAFYAHSLSELKDKKRHIPLSEADMRLMNPNTKTCPVFRSRRDADITRAIYQRVPVLIDRNRKEGGNPWGVRFMTMFHQTNDAELFHTAEQMKQKRYRLEDNHWTKGKKTFVPLYEAKMVQAYDHRAASVDVVESNWVRQGQTIEATLVEHQNPEHTATPRWWVDRQAVAEKLNGEPPPVFLGFKDITSPTNQRTMIASWIPLCAVTNHFPLLLSGLPPRRLCCLLGNLNSMAYDFAARQKMGGVTLNFFIVEQLPTFTPDTYDDPCPWDGSQTLEKWISDRVLKLSCTANDMKPLAQACGLKPPVHKWKPRERERLLAQLDAAYFILYGVTRDEMISMLTTFQGTRASDGADLFNPDPSVALSDAGQRIVETYDELRRDA